MFSSLTTIQALEFKNALFCIKEKFPKNCNWLIFVKYIKISFDYTSFKKFKITKLLNFISIFIDTGAYPRCKVCGKYVKYENAKIDTCSNKCAKHYFYKNATSEYKENILKKRKQTNLKKYGYENPAQVPEIHEKQQVSFKKYNKNYEYTLNSKVYNIQGSEPQCLDYLIKVENIYPQDIILRSIEGKPSIPYFDSTKNKNRIYHPDIYIKSQNRIIDVKSEYTYQSELQEIWYKIKGCKNLNYLFTLYIINKEWLVLNKIYG